MSYANFDTVRAEKRWTPILEGVGINKPETVKWMSEYSEYHQHAFNNGVIRENVAYANMSNVMGMGAVLAQPAPGAPGIPGGAGSDLGQQLLAVSMKIAAQTIGLDLVPTKPTPAPVIDLPFLDIVYDNTSGKDGYEKPQVFKLTHGSPLDAAALRTFFVNIMRENNVVARIGGLSKRLFVRFTTNDTTHYPATSISATDIPSDSAAKNGVLEFLGFSKIDGKPMLRSFRQVNAVSTGNFGFNQALNSFAAADVIGDVLAEATFEAPLGSTTVANTDVKATDISLISALEDHIPGFVSNWNQTAMPREQDEFFNAGNMGPRMEVKRITVGTVEVTAALKRNQIEDIKAQTGIDVVQKMEGVLVNEISQTISKEIVAKIYELGDKNRLTTPDAYGAGLDANHNKKFDFDIDQYLLAVAPNGETSHAVARKLVSRLRNAQSFLAVDGRIGPGQFIVTNGNIASALADIAGYTILPVDGKFNAPGAMYPHGTISGMTVYVDPYQDYSDNRMVMGRKNTVEQPGIVFVPYLMAQSISLISEATFAPRMLLRSRYAVAELGYYPWKQYLTIHVKDTNGILN